MFLWRESPFHFLGHPFLFVFSSQGCLTSLVTAVQRNTLQSSPKLCHECSLFPLFVPAAHLRFHLPLVPDLILILFCPLFVLHPYRFLKLLCTSCSSNPISLPLLFRPQRLSSFPLCISLFSIFLSFIVSSLTFIEQILFVVFIVKWCNSVFWTFSVCVPVCLDLSKVLTWRTSFNAPSLSCRCVCVC